MSESRAELEILHRRLAELERDNERLRTENAALVAQLAQMGVADADYVEEAGALFRRKVGGGYVETPYCPACKTAMSAFRGMFPFVCGRRSCGQQAGFKGADLPAVMARLPK